MFVYGYNKIEDNLKLYKRKDDYYEQIKNCKNKLQVKSVINRFIDDFYKISKESQKEILKCNLCFILLAYTNKEYITTDELIEEMFNRKIITKHDIMEFIQKYRFKE